MTNVGESRVQESTHFAVLDGLRGIAAATVLVGHTTAVILGVGGLIVPRKSLAVVFFFMLSGFVMSSAYEAKLGRGTTIIDFIVRRIIRLYPLILLGATLGSLGFVLRGIALGADGITAILLGLFAVPSPPLPYSFGYFSIDPLGSGLNQHQNARTAARATADA